MYSLASHSWKNSLYTPVADQTLLNSAVAAPGTWGGGMPDCSKQLPLICCNELLRIQFQLGLAPDPFYL